MSRPVVIILAAGHGTRMRSGTPKMAHPICGRPMVLWPVHAALEAGAGKVIVVDGPERALAPVLPAGVALAVQERQLGTADAVRAGAAQLGDDDTAIVLMGDVPLITAEAIRDLAAAHAAERAAATMLTTVLSRPDGYGRVVRSAGGAVERVVETKVPGDASEPELAIREVNTGVYAFAGGALLQALDHVHAANAQAEQYLPDALPALRAAGHDVAALRVDDETLVLGVNDRRDLAAVQEIAQRRVIDRHLAGGVTVIAPAATAIDVDVEIGQDSVLHPGTCLYGASQVGPRCQVGPSTTLVDAVLGEQVTAPHSYLVGCEVRDGASVGPFAYLRPGALLREGAKAGTFVEVKNSDVGAGAKVPHLSYVGDADVGAGTNLGAGTITANYDGEHKHRTRIGARVHGGVDVSLVAPVSVGDDAYTAAGSVITKDVPPGALGVARERQRNVEGYVERKRSEPPPERPR